MTVETMWMAGGFFELSYSITASSTSGHEIESYAKTTGDGSQVWDGVMPIKVTVTVNPGVNLGHTSPAGYGLDTGNGPWPTGSIITIINNGNMAGKGGDGGTSPNGAGQAGGTAINIQYPTTIQNNSIISGGGGGGGGGSPTGGTNPPGPPPGEAQGPNPGNPYTSPGGTGGGGAGYQPGDPGGSTTARGNGGHRAGAGGPLGAAGSAGTSGAAGAAGFYIKQNSQTVTWSATGTRNGSAQP
jgi:hypothetical protein